VALVFLHTGIINIAGSLAGIRHVLEYGPNDLLLATDWNLN